MTQFFKTMNNITLAKTVDRGDKIYLYDNANRQLGYYDKRNDTTYYNSGNAVGRGNLLSTLIPSK